MTIVDGVDRHTTGEGAKMRMVVFAASVGTVFEWYDFFLYGSLAVFFSTLFFRPVTKQQPSLPASPRSVPASP